MRKPIIVINFKSYIEATGHAALLLAKKIERVANFTKVPIIVSVQPTDINLIANETSLDVFAEHIDPFEANRNTGFITGEAVKFAGAKGTILNHSEHRVRIDFLEKSVYRAKKLGLKTIVCANDPLMILSVSSFAPDYVAYEPPELIAGDVSVSEAKPDIIKDIVSHMKAFNIRIPLLVGAGVKTNDDLKASMKFGADGVLIASGIVKAKDPEKALIDLLKNFY